MFDEPYTLYNWSIERPPASPEESGDRLERVISEVVDLASVEGEVSAADLVGRLLDEAAKQGIEATDAVVRRIMETGLGSPQEALERISGLSEEELEAEFPSGTAEIVAWYAHQPSS